MSGVVCLHCLRAASVAVNAIRTEEEEIVCD